MAISASTFRGFDPAAIEFMAELAANNDRAWFQPRKADFERLVKEPIEALVAELAERLDARDIPLHADPKRSIFRIYRDTRFSKDKSPYKTHLGASFPWMEPGDGRARGRRRCRRTATAGTSTSSRARCTSAAACGCRTRPGSSGSAGRSSRSPIGSGPPSRSRASWPPSDRSPRTRRQAACRRTAGRSPDGRPAALQGRRVRAAPGRRGGHVPAPARHARGCRSRPACPCSGSWPRSGRDTRPSGSGRPSGSTGSTGRRCATPASRSRRPAGTASGSTTTCSPTRATRPTRRWRAGRRSPRSPTMTRARPARTPRGGEHVPQPGPHGQAGDDARSPLRRPGRARHRRRLVRAPSTRRSGSTSGPGSASGSTGSTRRSGSSGGCSTASGSTHDGPLLRDARCGVRAAAGPGRAADPDRRLGADQDAADDGP